MKLYISAVNIPRVSPYLSVPTAPKYEVAPGIYVEQR